MIRSRFKISNWIMLATALLFLAPIIIMVLTSFKPEREVLNPASIIPQHWTLSNFRYVFNYSEEAPFIRWVINSVFVSTTVTLLVLTFSSMAAYAITRLHVPGGARMLGIIVVTMMLPAQLFLVPVYLILSWLHWLDTPAALIVPATAGGFGVFMLAAFMRAIPRSIEEAALIDGCSPLGVFLHINLPLSAGDGDAGHLHLHRLLERFRQPSGLHRFGTQLHVARRHRALSGVIQHRIRIDVDDQPSGDVAADRHVHVFPASDHRKHVHNRIEGITREPP